MYATLPVLTLINQLHFCKQTALINLKHRDDRLKQHGVRCIVSVDRNPRSAMPSERFIIDLTTCCLKLNLSDGSHERPRLPVQDKLHGLMPASSECQAASSLLDTSHSTASTSDFDSVKQQTLLNTQAATSVRASAAVSQASF